MGLRTVLQAASVSAPGELVLNSIEDPVVVLVVNVLTPPTGTTPSLTFTMQSVDPIDETTVYGPVKTLVFTATGVQTATLLTDAAAVKLSWSLTGTTPEFPSVNAVVFEKGTARAQVVNMSGAPTSTDAPADTTATGTLNVLDADVRISVEGKSSVGFQLSAGGLIGTIVAEVSYDGSLTWVPSSFQDATGARTSSVAFGAPNPSTARTIVVSGGISHVRVRVSAYTSGAAVLDMRATNVVDPVELYAGAPTAALPSLAAVIGGSDGALVQVPRVFDADTGAGSQHVWGVSVRKSASGGSVEAGTPADPFRVDPTGTTTQPVQDVPPTGLAHAQVTIPTAGTRVQLANTPCKSLLLRALASNTGTVFIGGVTVDAANGFPLARGDAIAVDISNANAIYVDTDVSGSKVAWIVVA